jgi:hypothetical protein
MAMVSIFDVVPGVVSVALKKVSGNCLILWAFVGVRRFEDRSWVCRIDIRLLVPGAVILHAQPKRL